MPKKNYYSEAKRIQVQGWRAANPDKAKAQTRMAVKKYNLRYKFNMTLEQYADLLTAQENRCAICRSAVPGGKADWHVDHNHDTNEVRGILCASCNLALGMMKDDPDRLAAAIRYLQNPPARDIIKTIRAVS